MANTNTTTYKISHWTGVAIVVANMIGTGVFTSLGFQVVELSNPAVILALWGIGGLLALAGAFSYVEIGTIIRKSGGEYIFLSQIFHPLLGYLAGWISLTVGFAAPVALSALAVVAYFPYADISPIGASIALVALISLIHSFSLKSSARFQNLSTLLKVAFICVFVIIGLMKSSPDTVPLLHGSFSGQFFSSAFAIALIYVSYSYSGWNAAVYITEEFEHPKRSLTYALIGGTAIVALMYTLLQFVFLKHVPVAELAGKVEVGAIAAQRILGSHMGEFFSLAISVLLVSSVSAMVWVGPRVTAKMARDFTLWKIFQSPEDKVPVKAIWLQFAITVALLLTGTFEQILIYCGFLLTLSSMLTVAGVFILRRRRPEAYHQTDTFISPLFPVFQLIYIAFSMVVIIFAFVDRPFEAVLGTSNLLIGMITWYINRFLTR